MGLLDDAIREHLELKRRHGADPSEVQRIESEALSPAKREAPAPAPAPVAEEDMPADLDDDPLADLPYRDAEPDEDYPPERAEDHPRERARDVPESDDLDAPVHHHHEPEPEAVYEVEPEALKPALPREHEP
ncbi:MAG: hypothetical protein ACXVFN_22795, partial [Solirubrobacteraceae bacterium]